jgi:hypothetical protein
MRILSQNDSPEVVECTARLLNGPSPVPRKYWLPLLGIDWDSREEKGKSEVFCGFLRELVKEWIKCGKRVMPERMVVNAASGGTPNGDWYHMHPYLAPEPAPVSEGQRMWDANDPAARTWLWRVYWDWIRRNVPRVWFQCNGLLRLTYISPAHSGPSRPSELPPFIESQSPRLRVWDESVLWFVLFLNCGHAHRLDCCRFCHRYFARRRTPKQKLDLKRGPQCGKCIKRGSVERTKSSRANRTNRMVGFAADFWEQWKPNSRDGQRSVWIANKVNLRTERIAVIEGRESERTTHYPIITGRWVTEHQTEIEAEVERRKHATGKSQR